MDDAADLEAWLASLPAARGEPPVDDETHPDRMSLLARIIDLRVMIEALGSPLAATAMFQNWVCWVMPKASYTSSSVEPSASVTRPLSAPTRMFSWVRSMLARTLASLRCTSVDACSTSVSR